jgi:hypothetical protein
MCQLAAGNDAVKKSQYPIIPKYVLGLYGSNQTGLFGLWWLFPRLKISEMDQKKAEKEKR